MGDAQWDENVDVDEAEHTAGGAYGEIYGEGDVLGDDEHVYDMGATQGEKETDDGAPIAADDRDQAVRLFCARWSRLRAQLDPLTSAVRGIRAEQSAIRRDLTAYMEQAGVRRATVCDRDGTPMVVVRVDPKRPTTSMATEVLTATVYEHVTTQLVEACAEAAAQRAQKQADKVAKARAVAARAPWRRPHLRSAWPPLHQLWVPWRPQHRPSRWPLWGLRSRSAHLPWCSSLQCLPRRLPLPCLPPRRRQSLPPHPRPCLPRSRSWPRRRPVRGR
nr:hypothetical protein [Pandoravirus massiliensis]